MAAAALQQRTQTTISKQGTLVGARSGVGYKLGQEVGSGGNGVVYAVSRRPELVAKIQKQTLSRHDVDKLEALVRGATPELLSVAAWPMDSLRSETGQIVGFVMPRILDARPLYELYSPRSRVQHFPSADFRFLVHVAANVARLFAAVHSAGFICGDVNHSNILVRQSGTVAAVDCDSFQVGDGSRFPCLVGTELFVPPELLGAALGATRRTANHDCFGLAVLIFHLLFMGRHPFAGRFLAKGEMPIERAIAESRFAYSRDRHRTQTEPPPYTPPMQAVGPAVVELFERAFHPNARHGVRPSPETWIDALESLKPSLVPCKKVPWHHHLPVRDGCPWCAIEVPARIKLFGGMVKVATAAIADLETLWARYLALADPGPPRALPDAALWQPPPRPKRDWRVLASRVRGDRLLSIGILIYLTVKFFADDLIAVAEQIAMSLRSSAETLVAMPATPHIVVLFSLCFVLFGPPLGSACRSALSGVARIFIRPGSSSRTRFKNRQGQRDAERAWRRATAAWQSQPGPPDLSDLRPVVDTLKCKLDALTLERDTRIRAGAAPETEEEQRARYLGGFRIEDAKLSTIGPSRCAVLRSWGIDTAADVDEAKIAAIPGFGKSLTDKLVIWREGLEKGFVYNSAPVIDPLEVQRIDRELAGRRTKLMKELRERIAELEQRAGGFVTQRASLWANVETAFEAMMMARRATW